MSCPIALLILLISGPGYATAASESALPRAPAEHRINSLPSLEEPLPSRHFSGLVPVPSRSFDYPWSGTHETLHTHYWLAEREHDPASAPIVLWLQGGPGGSSVAGSFTEMGPLALDDRSFFTASFNRTGIPSPIINTHGWTKASNFLAVEYANIGFSFCDAHPPHSQRDIHKCGWDDAAVANALLGFLRGFFELFPDYAKNELWIAGESYAGVLGPTAASTIVHANREAEAAAAAAAGGSSTGGSAASLINLVGVLHGNGGVGHNWGGPYWCCNGPVGFSTGDMPDDVRHHIDFFWMNGLTSNTMCVSCLNGLPVAIFGLDRWHASLIIYIIIYIIDPSASEGERDWERQRVPNICVPCLPFSLSIGTNA